MKKHGFTLAETLITLTIIGVVAAMTIPTLMNKYQEKTLESQFKKSYSILNQAAAISGRDYDCHMTWPYNYEVNDCNDFWDSILNQLKYTKYEKISTWPYKTLEEVSTTGGYIGCSTIVNKPNKYYLADGSTIYILRDFYILHHNAYMVLDVNGDKGPNKWGYDAFHLIPFKRPNNAVIFEDAICGIKEKGGKRVKNIITGSNEEMNYWNW